MKLESFTPRRLQIWLLAVPIGLTLIYFLFLAAPGYDVVKKQRFYRPLGGGIEFGERAEDAARRELQEELGAELTDLRLLGTFENLFTYQGRPGHELIWLYEARFTDASLYERDVLTADEFGSKFEVHWPVETFLRRSAVISRRSLWFNKEQDTINSPRTPDGFLFQRFRRLQRNFEGLRSLVVDALDTGDFVHRCP